MRQIFEDIGNEQFFREQGYLVFDLLDEEQIEDILTFYKSEFSEKREVFPYAQNLPYYISIFDKNAEHKKRTDFLISKYVKEKVLEKMNDYEVYYSNFMIKFPGDGQIEAHQDFNFVDESVYTACNLWCPLVDTSEQNGGLYVIPGSHKVFRTQRGVNLPQSLTQYNEMLKRYGCPIVLKKGQAIIFDHKLVHYSSPNKTNEARIAIQSVLKPVESAPCHCYFDQQTGKVRLCGINKEFILSNNLWDGSVNSLPLIHEEDLIPFPNRDEVIKKLIQLKLDSQKGPFQKKLCRIFSNESDQENFEKNGFLKLSLLNDTQIEKLNELFIGYSGGNVRNSDYGMYISLEEEDIHLKEKLTTAISAIIYPSIGKYFINTKLHLGSFLVKAPGAHSYTYPHQDWTFVDSPPYCSITVWIALVDTDVSNGTLGFVKGSQWFFKNPVGSPSPEFKTSTQEHGNLLYQYLEFVPLKAGEAIAFDNRTIHGAPPNVSTAHRIAVAIGITPKEATLFHHYLKPYEIGGEENKILKIKVDETFFHQFSVKKLKQLYLNNQLPAGYEITETLDYEQINFLPEEIEELCEQSGLNKNGKSLDLKLSSAESKINGSDDYRSGRTNKLYHLKQFISRLFTKS
jgi:ectoine hydroxylase-related dioxygenase (phytanoyl-CoA dioxygenase family)